MVLLASVDFRDRTSEFNESVARLRRQNQGGASAPLQTQQTGGSRAEPSSLTRGDAAQGGATAALPQQQQHQQQQQQQQQSEFSRRAAAIGRTVHEVHSSKVAQLRALTKQSTVFNDPSEEIDRLTRVIKQDIQGISGGISALQEVAEAEGAAGGSRQSSTHSSTVVESLRARLRDAAKEFKEVLTARTDSLRVQQSRRQMYSAAPPMFAAPPSSSFGSAPPPMMPPSSGLGGQVPVLRRRTAATSAHELFGGAGAGTQVGPGGHFQQQQQQLYAPQQSARAEELRNVESTIVELGGIFTQMASMVQEQGEAMLRIDENIEDTLGNVEGAQAYMLKYMNAVSSNRGLILKILAALAFMIFLFVVFVL